MFTMCNTYNIGHSVPWLHSPIPLTCPSPLLSLFKPSLFPICAVVVLLVSESICTSSSPSHTLPGSPGSTGTPLEAQGLPCCLSQGCSRGCTFVAPVTWPAFLYSIFTQRPIHAPFRAPGSGTECALVPFSCVLCSCCHHVSVQVLPSCKTQLEVFSSILPGRDNVSPLPHPFTHCCRCSAGPLRAHAVQWSYASASPMPITAGKLLGPELICVCLCTYRAMATEATQKMWVNEQTKFHLTYLFLTFMIAIRTSHFHLLWQLSVFSNQ